MEHGKLFVLSGPSGAGKGSICKKLIKKDCVDLSVSMTTRAPRNAEEEGKSYFFVTEDEFQSTIDVHGFMEYAKIYDHYYGTPKKYVMDKLAQGKDVILEIEMQGAFQIKNAYPNCTLIFILPPSLAELRKRLIERGTEDEEEIRIRQQATLNEIDLIHDYDYYIINDDLEEAVKKVEHIISAEHSKVTEAIRILVQRYEEEI